MRKKPPSQTGRGGLPPVTGTRGAHSKRSIFRRTLFLMGGTMVSPTAS